MAASTLNLLCGTALGTGEMCDVILSVDFCQFRVKFHVLRGRCKSWLAVGAAITQCGHMHALLRDSVPTARVLAVSQRNILHIPQGLGQRPSHKPRVFLNSRVVNANGSF